MRWLAATLLVGAMTSCAYSFEVAVTPSPQGPRFSIGSVRASAVPRAPGCARQVVVLRSGERRPIWVISRVATCPTTRTFVYGIVPDDWEEHVTPEPLRPGIAYEVSIGAGGGSGGTRFLSDGSDLGRYRPFHPR